MIFPKEELSGETNKKEKSVDFVVYGWYTI